MPRRYRHCPHCAAALATRTERDLARQVCTGCGFVFWQNPAVGVAVVLIEDGRVLLGRRSRGAYAGQWCIPCGYVEYDEDVREAARREFEEETGLVVELGPVRAVHSNFHNPAQHTVGIWFDARAVGGVLRAADDLDEVRFFAAPDIPAALAFPTDRVVLRDLFGT
ncbi:MAG: NUDIX domain-containing protein [Gammaproteobacteria bacterium]